MGNAIMPIPEADISRVKGKYFKASVSGGAELGDAAPDVAAALDEAAAVMFEANVLPNFDPYRHYSFVCDESLQHLDLRFACIVQALGQRWRSQPQTRT
jgi:hypothetical protein